MLVLTDFPGQRALIRDEIEAAKFASLAKEDESRNKVEVKSFSEYYCEPKKEDGAKRDRIQVILVSTVATDFHQHSHVPQPPSAEIVTNVERITREYKLDGRCLYIFGNLTEMANHSPAWKELRRTYCQMPIVK